MMAGRTRSCFPLRRGTDRRPRDRSARHLPLGDSSNDWLALQYPGPQTTLVKLYPTLVSAIAWAIPCLPGRAQAPPLREQSVVEPFWPGTIATVNGISFTADARTVYVSHWADPVIAGARRRVQLFRHRSAPIGWHAAEPVLPSGFRDYQPVLAPNERRLYFTSTRPLPGTEAEARQNIWVADREGDAWVDPRPILSLVTNGWDGYAVPTASGRLYFVSDRPGGQGGVDIWVADPDGENFGSPRNLVALNSADGESDIYIDAEERFMIFQRYVDSSRAVDLWIAFRVDGAWRAPRLLDGVNGPDWELSPTVDADRRELFFQREGTIFRADFCNLLTLEERALLGTCPP